MRTLVGFAAIAALVTVTPGAATALVVRSTLRGGRRRALRTILGNEVGVLTWALLSAFGVSVLVTASQVAHDALRIGGAVVLVVLGGQAIARSLRGEDPAPRAADASRDERGGFAIGVATSLTNPKLVVFFMSLFPQFISEGVSPAIATTVMATMIALFDLAWYMFLATLVSRAQRVLSGVFQRWTERLTGAVLIGLGARLVLERRSA